MAGTHQLVAGPCENMVFPVQLRSHVRTAVQVAVNLALVADEQCGRGLASVLHGQLIRQATVGKAGSRADGNCGISHESSASYSPPAHCTTVPVMYEAAGDSTQATVSAISSGWARRPMGILGATRWGRPGSPAAAWMSVRVDPGETPHTRMPWPAT